MGPMFGVYIGQVRVVVTDNPTDAERHYDKLNLTLEAMGSDKRADIYPIEQKWVKLPLYRGGRVFVQ